MIYLILSDDKLIKQGAKKRGIKMKTLLLTFIDDETIVIRNIRNMYYACGYLNIYYKDGSFERYEIEQIDNFNVL